MTISLLVIPILISIYHSSAAEIVSYGSDIIESIYSQSPSLSLSKNHFVDISNATNNSLYYTLHINDSDTRDCGSIFVTTCCKFMNIADSHSDHCDDISLDTTIKLYHERKGEMSLLDESNQYPHCDNPGKSLIDLNDYNNGEYIIGIEGYDEEYGKFSVSFVCYEAIEPEPEWVWRTAVVVYYFSWVLGGLFICCLMTSNLMEFCFDDAAPQNVTPVHESTSDREKSRQTNQIVQNYQIPSCTRAAISYGSLIPPSTTHTITSFFATNQSSSSLLTQTLKSQTIPQILPTTTPKLQSSTVELTSAPKTPANVMTFDGPTRECSSLNLTRIDEKPEDEKAEEEQEEEKYENEKAEKKQEEEEEEPMAQKQQSVTTPYLTNDGAPDQQTESAILAALQQDSFNEPNEYFEPPSTAPVEPPNRDGKCYQNECKQKIDLMDQMIFNIKGGGVDIYQVVAVYIAHVWRAPRDKDVRKLKKKMEAGTLKKGSMDRGLGYQKSNDSSDDEGDQDNQDANEDYEDNAYIKPDHNDYGPKMSMFARFIFVLLTQTVFLFVI